MTDCLLPFPLLSIRPSLSRLFSPLATITSFHRIPLFTHAASVHVLSLLSPYACTPLLEYSPLDLTWLGRDLYPAPHAGRLASTNLTVDAAATIYSCCSSSHFPLSALDSAPCRPPSVCSARMFHSRNSTATQRNTHHTPHTRQPTCNTQPTHASHRNNKTCTCNPLPPTHSFRRPPSQFRTYTALAPHNPLPSFVDGNGLPLPMKRD